MLRLWQVSQGLPPPLPREEDGAAREVGVSAALLHGVQQEGVFVLRHVPDVVLRETSEGQVCQSRRPAEVRFVLQECPRC